MTPLTPTASALVALGEPCCSEMSIKNPAAAVSLYFINSSGQKAQLWIFELPKYNLISSSADGTDSCRYRRAESSGSHQTVTLPILNSWARRERERERESPKPNSRFSRWRPERRYGGFATVTIMRWRLDATSRTLLFDPASPRAVVRVHGSCCCCVRRKTGGVVSRACRSDDPPRGNLGWLYGTVGFLGNGVAPGGAASASHLWRRRL